MILSARSCCSLLPVGLFLIVSTFSYATTNGEAATLTITVFSAFHSGDIHHNCHVDVFKKLSHAASRHYRLTPTTTVLGYHEDADWDRIDMFHFLSSSHNPWLAMGPWTEASSLNAKKCYRRLWVAWGPPMPDPPIAPANPTWLLSENSSAVAKIARERRLNADAKAYADLFREPDRRHFFLNLVKHREFAIDDSAQQTAIPGLACGLAYHKNISLLLSQMNTHMSIPPPFGMPLFLQDRDPYFSWGVSSDFKWTVILLTPYANHAEIAATFVGESMPARLCRTSCATCAERHLVVDTIATQCPLGDLACSSGLQL